MPVSRLSIGNMRCKGGLLAAPILSRCVEPRWRLVAAFQGITYLDKAFTTIRLGLLKNVIELAVGQGIGHRLHVHAYFDLFVCKLFVDSAEDLVVSVI